MTKNLISCGFVASHLADLLLEKGEEVYVYCRWTDDKRSFEHIKDKVHWVAMDLNDAWSCLKAIEEVKPDYIYHLGAQSSVPESFAYPAQTLMTNGIGTLNLLEAVRQVRDKYRNVKDELFEAHLVSDSNGIESCPKCGWDSIGVTPETARKLDHIAFDIANNYYFDPVIHVCSSSEVYGVVPEDQQPIKETTPFNPANPYAVSKVTEDQLALMYYTNYKLKTIRTRFFTHTGPRRVMMSAECFYAKRIAEIEKEMGCINGAWQTSDKSPTQEELNKEYVIKLGNMQSIRTWADVRDAVRAYYLLARSGRYGEVFNVGGNTVKSIQEILDILLSFSKLDKSKITFEVDPKLLRPYDVMKQTVDISKLMNTIDWKPTIPIEKTMEDLLNDWRNRV